MRLIAAMNTRNERDRYLETTIPALLDWVDEIRVRDDGSTDGTPEYLEGFERVTVLRRTGNLWAENEGRQHAELLEWALEARPTHVLAIDADEIVPDGERVRELLETDLLRGVEAITYTLRMVELWGLDPPVARCDGGWRPHPVAVLYRVPEAVFDSPRPPEWGIDGRKLASPRVPRIVVRELRRRRAVDLEADILHLGWSREAEREARARRYQELDGGRYHAKRHLDSILWPDRKCDLRPYEGPVPAIA